MINMLQNSEIICFLIYKNFIILKKLFISKYFLFIKFIKSYVKRKGRRGNGSII